MPFSKSNRPKLPDSYFNVNNILTAPVVPSPGMIVAIPFTSDWGPFKEAKLLNSFAEYQAMFGYSENTPGYIAVKQAFIGEGLPGRGGAGAVLAYRFGAAAAAKATKALQNVTPAAGLTLTGKYVGTRANALKVTVRENAGSPTTLYDLLIIDGTTTVEEYTFAKTNITEAAALINARSAWVTAVANITGVALKIEANQALAGGLDGETPIAEDWTNMFNQIALERFALFAPYNLTEPTIVASMHTWMRDQNDNKGKHFMCVIGGAIGESLATANTRANAMSDPEVVSIGVGTYRDEDLGPASAPLELSTAQLAPRIAGILAAKGEYASLTYARLHNLVIVTGPTDAEIASAYDNGTVVLARDDDAEAPTFVKVGHSTWAESDANAEGTSPLKPYKIYREPKYVRTIQGVQTDLAAYFRTEILGLRPVNDDTRDAVVSEAKSLLDTRERLQVIQPGWKVGIDQDPPPSDDDEFVALVMELKFGRALKQVYVTLTVG